MINTKVNSAFHPSGGK